MILGGISKMNERQQTVLDIALRYCKVLRDGFSYRNLPNHDSFLVTDILDELESCLVEISDLERHELENN